MSEREEDDERNKNCPSRGVGIGVAVAAIGVGVGAALYYFMNRGTQNPNAAGSTTMNWNCEAEQNLHGGENEQNSDDSFTTISEHSTTDTSINDVCDCGLPMYDSDSNSSDSDSNSSDSDSNSSDSDSDSSNNDTFSDTDYSELCDSSASSDSDFMEWDVTHSTDVPIYAPPERIFLSDYAISLFSSRTKDRNDSARRTEAFRKRSWSLEECSICFEVILRDDEVMSLPCTHHFHTKCILPWLQEQQTCPNCRKNID